MTFFLTEQTCALLCVIGPGVMQRSTSFVFIFLTWYNPLQHSQPTGTETGQWLKAAAPAGGGALGEAHQEGPHGPLTMPQRSPVTSPTGDRTDTILQIALAPAVPPAHTTQLHLPTPHHPRARRAPRPSAGLKGPTVHRLGHPASGLLPLDLDSRAGVPSL